MLLSKLRLCYRLLHDEAFSGWSRNSSARHADQLLLTYYATFGHTKTTPSPYHLFRVSLASYSDRYYAINASVGTPGKLFTLTVDSTIQDAILADDSSVNANVQHRFSPLASSSFRYTSTTTKQKAYDEERDQVSFGDFANVFRCCRS